MGLLYILNTIFTIQLSSFSLKFLFFILDFFFIYLNVFFFCRDVTINLNVRAT
jgi:hypothetical protein